MKSIDLIIVYLLFLGVFTFCSLDSKSNDSKDNQEKIDSNTTDSDSVKVSKTGDSEGEEQKFEFQLLNDSVGKYFSKGTDSPIFIYTDSSGNIPYDTAMHKYIDIDGAGCYADKDEISTLVEIQMKLGIFDGIRFISSSNGYNIFIVSNKESGDKEFLLVSDSDGLLKSFIEIKHSVWTIYCNARRDYEIIDNQNGFSVEFTDYVSRKEPDFRNEVRGALLVDESGDIVIKFNENQE